MKLILVVLLVALAVFDVLSTLQAFKRGAVEANPLMKWLQQTFPKLWPAFRVLVALVLAWVLYQSDSQVAIWELVAADLLWAWVVYHNYSIAWRKS